jgi:hypothetical protein
MRFLAGNAAAVEHSGKLWMYVTRREMSCSEGYGLWGQPAKERACYAADSGFEKES